MRKGSKRTGTLHCLFKPNQDENDLIENETNLFQHGSSCSFLLNEFNHLGDILSVKIYSDNYSNKPDTNWFIRYVIVYDLSLKNITYFIIYEWLRCKSSSRSIMYEFYASNQFELLSFGHLFLSKLTKYFILIFTFA